METKRMIKNRQRRTHRVRTKINRGDNRPRLSIHISNRHISAQIIDDKTGKTLVASSSVGRKLSGPMTEMATKIGEDIAAKATKAGIKQVVYDRGSKLYHGRVKALAEAARAKGLEF